VTIGSDHKRPSGSRDDVTRATATVDQVTADGGMKHKIPMVSCGAVRIVPGFAGGPNDEYA
jgi:hypothetical protein